MAKARNLDELRKQVFQDPARAAASAISAKMAAMKQAIQPVVEKGAPIISAGINAIKPVYNAAQDIRQKNHESSVQLAMKGYKLPRPEAEKLVAHQDQMLGAVAGTMGGDVSWAQPSNIGAPLATNPSAFRNPNVGGSLESMAERAGGWQPGMRAQFDTALLTKDSNVLAKLLPMVPVEYKARFATEIANILKGVVR